MLIAGGGVGLKHAKISLDIAYAVTPCLAVLNRRRLAMPPMACCITGGWQAWQFLLWISFLRVQAAFLLDSRQPYHIPVRLPDVSGEMSVNLGRVLLARPSFWSGGQAF